MLCALLDASVVVAQSVIACFDVSYRSNLAHATQMLRSYAAAVEALSQDAMRRAGQVQKKKVDGQRICLVSMQRVMERWRRGSCLKAIFCWNLNLAAGISVTQAKHNQAERTIRGLKVAKRKGGVQMLSFIWRKWSLRDQAAAVALWQLGLVEHKVLVQLAREEARGLELETTLSQDLRLERRFRGMVVTAQVMKRWREEGLLRAVMEMRANFAADRATSLMEESEQVTYVFAQEARSALP